MNTTKKCEESQTLLTMTSSEFFILNDFLHTIGVQLRMTSLDGKTDTCTCQARNIYREEYILHQHHIQHIDLHEQVEKEIASKRWER